MPLLSIARFFEDTSEKLKLTWVAGRAGSGRNLNSEVIKGSTKGLIGHLNFIHPNWIQVLGSTEVEYLSRLAAGQSLKMVRLGVRDGEFTYAFD